MPTELHDKPPRKGHAHGPYLGARFALPFAILLWVALAAAILSHV